ncbi:MAG: T9SS type A sorting domain-containing protein, partial [Bacteroidota bacterium]
PVPNYAIFSGIHFFDGMNGAAFNRFQFYSTENGGVTWQTETVPYGRRINSVWFSDKHSAWLAGIGGTILYRSDSVELSVAGNRPSSQRISVYPNPTSGSITVVFDQVSAPSFPVCFKLTDLLGRVVQSSLIESKQETHRINLPRTAEGLYIGTFETKDHQRSFAKIYIKE